MAFPGRLVALRKTRGLTQQALADLVNVHLSQVQRYEAGTSQPTLEVIRRLAVIFSVSADTLVFDDDERGPQGDEFKLILEGVNRLSPHEKSIVKEVIQSLLNKYQAS